MIALVTDEEKCLLQQQLQQQMRLIGERYAVSFFLRGADNLELAPVVILLGTRKEPLPFGLRLLRLSRMQCHG